MQVPGGLESEPHWFDIEPKVDMARTSSLQSVLDQFIERFASQLASRLRSKVSGTQPAARSGRPGRPAGKVSGRTGRICPVPGCGKPGAGPRNRWFCSEHAKSVPRAEQNRLLDKARAQLAASPKASSAKASKRGRPGRKLDMRCRVAGCKNMSRGPRFGFICDEHKKLSKADQQAARDAYNKKK